MKILVVCQYYYPEPFRITDICEELVKKGHEVSVLTGIPNYPEGRIYQGYGFGKKRKEIINGVKIQRCFTIGRRKGILFRFLNYYSFAFSSFVRSFFIKEKFDAVFVNQLSPVMMAEAAINYKKRSGAKMYLYCLDLWPESLAAGGIKKGSPIYRLYHRVSERIYKKADNILVSSKSFSDYFEDEFGIENTVYLPQYAEALFTAEKCRKEPDEKIDIMFAGNIGAAQSMDTVVYAAEKTKDIKNLYWHIVGDGSELERIKKLAETLDIRNMVFYGRKPLKTMPEYYSKADAMLVTMQKDETICRTLPGKVQTYMAAGKTILGAIDGETAEVINESGCGKCCGAEDSCGLAEIVRSFCENKAAEQCGNNSLDYYEKMFSKNSVITKLEKILAGEE